MPGWRSRRRLGSPKPPSLSALVLVAVLERFGYEDEHECEDEDGFLMCETSRLEVT